MRKGEGREGKGGDEVRIRIYRRRKMIGDEGLV
jgi:hypothetical protein